MTKIKSGLLLLFLFWFSGVFADRSIDSLENVLKRAGTDTATLKSYIALANAYVYKDAGKALIAIDKALDLARNLKIKAAICDAHRTKAFIHSISGNTDKAIESYEVAMSLSDSAKDAKGYAAVILNLGLCYYQKTEFNKALPHFQKAELYFEKIGFKTGLANCYLNTGLLFDGMDNRKLAFQYYNKALLLYRELDQPSSTVRCYLNLGTLWMKENDLGKAMSCFTQGEKIALEIGDVNALAQLTSNIGLIYDYRNRNDSALLLYGRAMQYAREYGDSYSLSGILGNTGYILYKEKKYAQALPYFEQTLELVQSSGQNDFLAESYQNLAKCYRGMKRLDKAYEYLELYAQTKDTLMSEQNSRALIEMETKYRSEKKDNEIKLLNKDKALQEATVYRQRVVIWSAAAALVIVLVFALLIYRNFREKKKANLLLAQRHAEIQLQKEIIEEKNKDILASITYARRIQRSLLPTERYIARNLETLRPK